MRFPLTSLQKLLLPLGALLFDFLFWQERAGLNMLLYTVFVLAASVATLPRQAGVLRSGYFRAAFLGAIFSGLMVAVYGSFAAYLACVASLALVLGYINQPHLKLVGYALLTALANQLRVVPVLARLLRAPRPVGANAQRIRFYGRLLVVPVVALGVFHGLFVLANPRYAEYSGRALEVLGEWLSALLPEISVPHLLFFLLGLTLTAGALLVVPVHFFADQESRFGEFVRRQRDRVASFAVRRPNFQPQAFRALDLRKEYLVALGLFGLVNALLLVVNLIDMQWIWFGFAPAPGFDLTQFVHEGTYVLILSILVAMGIVLWFFRRNLNFYAPGLRWLRVGATVWVAQNAVLAVSVALRNYYYILYTGLAYKRIGVYGFLLLTFFGLATILLKIWQRRSAYALVRLNALAAYAVLLLLAAGNWEIWMVRYNLQPRFRRVDYGFLLAMPDRVLPELAAHAASMPGRQLTIEGDGRWVAISWPEAQARLQQRLRAFEALEQRRHWQSWTYLDRQAYHAITTESTQTARATSAAASAIAHR
ncbi:DUF4173 domain-containing protein [Hymenobacter aquaticus]|uniref:DUF4173 domain-containing protein n=1 Tax=Hymenobacter aquaticus TaxID=1867101 RepID=A0A4Z0PWW0_9BACT|nr:DUF4173 domain-containing protein [Hymenobacter aquaticus]TGE22187.1 DUF4173 domain-containing protein [Hymenobacter aquaticus]